MIPGVESMGKDKWKSRFTFWQLSEMYLWRLTLVNVESASKVMFFLSHLSDILLDSAKHKGGRHKIRG